MKTKNNKLLSNTAPKETPKKMMGCFSATCEGLDGFASPRAFTMMVIATHAIFS